jgi:hypothetical protein
MTCINLQPLAEVEEFVEAAGEFLVIGWNGAFAIGGVGHALVVRVEVFGKASKDAVQVVAVKGGDAFVLEGFDELREELLAADLFDHRGDRFEEVSPWRIQAAKLRVLKRRLASSAGHSGNQGRKWRPIGPSSR